MCHNKNHIFIRYSFKDDNRKQNCDFEFSLQRDERQGFFVRKGETEGTASFVPFLGKFPIFNIFYEFCFLKVDTYRVRFPNPHSVDTVGGITFTLIKIPVSKKMGIVFCICDGVSFSRIEYEPSPKFCTKHP